MEIQFGCDSLVPQHSNADNDVPCRQKLHVSYTKQTSSEPSQLLVPVERTGWRYWNIFFPFILPASYISLLSALHFTTVPDRQAAIYLRIFQVSDWLQFHPLSSEAVLPLICASLLFTVGTSDIFHFITSKSISSCLSAGSTRPHSIALPRDTTRLYSGCSFHSTVALDDESHTPPSLLYPLPDAPCTRLCLGGFRRLPCDVARQNFSPGTPAQDPPRLLLRCLEHRLFSTHAFLGFASFCHATALLCSHFTVQHLRQAVWLPDRLGTGASYRVQATASCFYILLFT